jgi:hypothetical protein
MVQESEDKAVVKGQAARKPKIRSQQVLNFAQNGELTANLRRGGCNLRSAKPQKARTFCPVWVS